MENNGTKHGSTITPNDTINKGLIKNLKIHTNLAQEVIVTTEDKIRLCLTNYLNKMGKKHNWIAPIGILLTIIITLLTTSFKKFIFSPDTWVAIFVIGGGLNFLWFLLCLKDAFMSVDMDEVIEEIKKGSSLDREKGNIIFLDKEKRFVRLETPADVAPVLIPKKSTRKITKSLKVIKAIYGIEGNNIDLTTKLNDQIKEGKLIVEVTNALAGSDPVPGTHKYLDIEYVVNTKKFSKKFQENEMIKLP